ncbi:low temperature requirement protein A [Streptomyces lavendulocolor]|uniref:low temperature requirement protein A n=1 Tax=Streptomyces lavendulocolor TaxID=67316 RepID=UPI003C2B5A1E
MSGVLWAASAFVPGSWRCVMWALLVVAELVLLLTARGRGLPRRLHTGLLVERVGLFVIIVLGESVLALVTSTDHVWTAAAGVVAVLGFTLLAALWWSYFDFGSSTAELVLGSAEPQRAYLLARDVAAFLHFFVTAAILCLAAGLATAVEEAGHAHLHRARSEPSRAGSPSTTRRTPRSRCASGGPWAASRCGRCRGSAYRWWCSPWRTTCRRGSWWRCSPPRRSATCCTRGGPSAGGRSAPWVTVGARGPAGRRRPTGRRADADCCA